MRTRQIEIPTEKNIMFLSNLIISVIFFLRSIVDSGRELMIRLSLYRETQCGGDGGWNG